MLATRSYYTTTFCQLQLIHLIFANLRGKYVFNSYLGKYLNIEKKVTINKISAYVKSEFIQIAAD